MPFYCSFQTSARNDEDVFRAGLGADRTADLRKHSRAQKHSLSVFSVSMNPDYICSLYSKSAVKQHSALILYFSAQNRENQNNNALQIFSCQIKGSGFGFEFFLSSKQKKQHPSKQANAPEKQTVLMRSVMFSNPLTQKCKCAVSFQLFVLPQTKLSNAEDDQHADSSSQRLCVTDEGPALDRLSFWLGS